MEKLINILGLIASMYLIASSFYTIYFYYLYAQNHDFISTLIVGPFIVILKGLVFPFFM